MPPSDQKLSDLYVHNLYVEKKEKKSKGGFIDVSKSPEESVKKKQPKDREGFGFYLFIYFVFSFSSLLFSFSTLFLFFLFFFYYKKTFTMVRSTTLFRHSQRLLTSRVCQQQQYRKASTIALTDLKTRWETMSATEQNSIAKELEEAQKGDWKALSAENKQAACKSYNFLY